MRFCRTRRLGGVSLTAVGVGDVGASSSCIYAPKNLHVATGSRNQRTLCPQRVRPRTTKIRILPHVRAIDDLSRGFLAAHDGLHITTVWRIRHARSPQRVSFRVSPALRGITYADFDFVVGNTCTSTPVSPVSQNLHHLYHLYHKTRMYIQCRCEEPRCCPCMYALHACCAWGCRGWFLTRQ